MRRKRKLRARKPARVRGDDESAGGDASDRSGDDSATVVPPLRRQRTRAIDDPESEGTRTKQTVIDLI